MIGSHALRARYLPRKELLFFGIRWQLRRTREYHRPNESIEWSVMELEVDALSTLRMVEGDGGQTQGLSIEDVERLYRDQFRPVYNYLYFRLLNHATAEDLLADVFVRVVRARETFDPAKATPEAWLWRIARNRLFDHFRSMRKVDDIEQVSEARFAVTDNYDGLDDTAQQARQLLAVLSPEDRELVYLKYWQEMPNKQIAELLDLNASTVSTRLSRAMAKMRKAAEPQS